MAIEALLGIVGAVNATVAFFATLVASASEDAWVGAIGLRVPVIGLASKSKRGREGCLPFFTAIETFPIVSATLRSIRTLTSHMPILTAAITTVS